MNFEDFLSHICKHDQVTRDNQRFDTLDKPVMVMDVDGELFHLKSMAFDNENNCWIVYLEN